MHRKSFVILVIVKCYNKISVVPTDAVILKYWQLLEEFNSCVVRMEKNIEICNIYIYIFAISTGLARKKQTGFSYS